MIGPAYRYRATATRVVDGDTLEALIDLGFRVSIRLPVRIAGIDAPELRGATKLAGQAARAHLEVLVLGQPLILESHRDDRSFERWVCDLWLPTGESMADRMVADGMAVRA